MGKVLVAGSINMDVVAFSKRLPRPGETVIGTQAAFYPGGKGANQAVASARAGVETRMFGRVGTDIFGAEMLAFLKASGVDAAGVEIVEGGSGTAVIFVADDGENSIVVAPGANASFRAPDIECDEGDVLVAQFEVPLDSVKDFLDKGKASGAKTLLNPAPAAEFDFMDIVDVLVVNETELQMLTKEPTLPTSPEAIAQTARLLRARPEQVVVVTLGAEGAVACVQSDCIWSRGHEVEAHDTTGAGDCFVGSLAARLSQGDEIENAMEYANTAAALSVQRVGAGPSMPSAKEVLTCISAGKAES